LVELLWKGKDNSASVLDSTDSEISDDDIPKKTDEKKNSIKVLPHHPAQPATRVIRSRSRREDTTGASSSQPNVEVVEIAEGKVNSPPLTEQKGEYFILPVASIFILIVQVLFKIYKIYVN